MTKVTATNDTINNTIVELGVSNDGVMFDSINDDAISPISTVTDHFNIT
jgi:hypothetical protein